MAMFHLLCRHTEESTGLLSEGSGSFPVCGPLLTVILALALAPCSRLSGDVVYMVRREGV